MADQKVPDYYETTFPFSLVNDKCLKYRKLLFTVRSLDDLLTCLSEFFFVLFRFLTFKYYTLISFRNLTRIQLSGILSTLNRIS